MRVDGGIVSRNEGSGLMPHEINLFVIDKSPFTTNGQHNDTQPLLSLFNILSHYQSGPGHMFPVCLFGIFLRASNYEIN